MPRRPKFDTESISKSLGEVLGAKQIEGLARRSGFLKRKGGKVAPLAFLVACVSTLGASTAQWLADIVRTFNRFTGEAVRYKPFHKHLAKPGFPKFMKAAVEHAIAKLTLPVLQPYNDSALSEFDDIILHDGTSFRLKDTLATVWPGRFTKGSPAAVELHVTMSALTDSPIQIALAPDKEAERPFSPCPEQLQRCLLLEDRGYEDRKVFARIKEAGGSFIIRGNRAMKPTVRRAYNANGRRLRQLEGKRLDFKRLPRESIDLDIDWDNGRGHYQGRLVVLYKAGKRNKKNHTALHTNLSRKRFSLETVGKLYRLRWQIELLFKEWKSFANLHRFDTSVPEIAEGLIWASLLAATLKRYICHAAEQVLGVELSTQRVANTARHFLDDILRCFLDTPRRLTRVLVELLGFFRENTRRAHPERDRKTGRLAVGLRPTVELRD